MISIIRGKILSFLSNAGRISRFTASGRSGEKFIDREAFQNFGFTSGIPEGADAIIVKTGQNIYLIASDDRRYRIAVENGETAIYNQDGDNIILKRNHTIEINAGLTGTVIVNAGSVYLGGQQLATIGGGVVTANCACITGGIHPIGSQSVKAAL